MSQLDYFPGQKPGEKVLALVRPHWMVMLRDIVAFVFLFILPIIVLIGASASDLEPFGPAARPLTVILAPAFYLMLLTWFFIRWLDFYLDVGIVTDQRVLDIDQRGLFRRNVGELDVKMVQDVAADKTGILPTLFDFGDVVIQTAGERPNFTFQAVPHPDKVVDLLQHSIADRTASEEEASEKIAEAAEEMKEAAQTIKEEVPKQPENPSAAQQPPANPPAEDSQDLPREYER